MPDVWPGDRCDPETCSDPDHPVLAFVRLTDESIHCMLAQYIPIVKC